MTRLTEKDLVNLDQLVENLDYKLKNSIDASLVDVASFVAGIPIKTFNEASTKYKIAVIPITSGGGVIGNFSQTVASVPLYLGYDTFITSKTDVSGIAEAIQKKADILFMADDNQFIALNLKTNKIADNGEATAKAYVASLHFHGKGLVNREVLVIGAGIVGGHCVQYLLELGAKVAVYDTDNDKLVNLPSSVTIEKYLSRALPNYQYIIDASPEGSFMDLENLHPDVVISAPGMPLGLTTNTYAALEKRVIHDPLQIGVATMLAIAVSP